MELASLVRGGACPLGVTTRNKTPRPWTWLKSSLFPLTQEHS